MMLYSAVVVPKQGDFGQWVSVSNEWWSNLDGKTRKRRVVSSASAI